MSIKSHYFILLLLALCVAYLGFELFFNSYALITVDEFWFAHRSYQYKSGLPYVDFAPYKTVLGYYILLLPMLFTHGVLTTLIAMKDFIAVINTLVLFSGAYWLTRFFSKQAVLLSLAVILTSQIMLFDSTNIRVDLLGYWFGFFSLLSLLEVVSRLIQNKSHSAFSVLAGILMGLAFCTTQKTIWYLAAADIAFFMLCLFSFRSFKSYLALLIFNLLTLFTIALYLDIWSHLTSWHTVYQSVFVEASAMYHLDWYAPLRKEFWQFLLINNPLIFFLWPLTLFSIMITTFDDSNFHLRAFIVIFAAVILFCLIPYKQIFPYYLQVSLPILFTLFASFFSWLFDLLNNPNHIQAKNKVGRLWTLFIVYSATTIYIINQFQLTYANLLVCILPFLFCMAGANKLTRNDKSIALKICLCTILFIGVIYPFQTLVGSLRQYNGQYQHANVKVINALLEQGGGYVAGIELVYNNSQTIPGLRHLMGPAIAYLSTPTPTLRAVMLPSLYEDPNATPASIIKALDQSQVKFYVNNYRMAALPPSIHQYLQNQFEHYWGSIYLYAPLIAANAHVVNVKFDGDYLVESQASDVITLGQLGKAQLKLARYRNGEKIHLGKGNYLTKAKQTYRLKLVPELGKLDPSYSQDMVGRILF